MKLEQFLQNYNTEDIINAIILMSNDSDTILEDAIVPANEWIASNVIRFNEVNSYRIFDITAYNELKQISTDAYLSYMLEIFEDIIKQEIYSEEIKNDNFISMMMRLKNLVSRGDGYQFQLIETAEKFYKPFNSDFMKTLGFTFSVFEGVFIYIYKRYLHILLHTQNDSERINRIHEHSFKVFKFELYKLFPKDEIDSIVKHLSIRIGDINLKAIAPQDFKPLYSKPIVDFDEYIYFPIAISTSLNFPKMFHYLFIAENIFDKDVINRYTKNRGAVIENLAKEYLLRLFKKVYVSLRYPSNSKRFEADITAQSENATIFVEAKGKLLTLSSLNGNLESVKDDIYKAIGKAYEQAIRSIEHVESHGAFIETKKNGDKEILLNNTPWKFPLCILAENFEFIPSEIYNYVEINQERLMPYAVDIYDLDIITRECTSKEEFINYLLFRQMNSKKLTVMDELDAFGYFKKYGIVEITIDADKVIATSYKDDIDNKYYNFNLRWLDEFYDVK